MEKTGANSVLMMAQDKKHKICYEPDLKIVKVKKTLELTRFFISKVFKQSQGGKKHKKNYTRTHKNELSTGGKNYDFSYIYLIFLE